MIGERLLNAGLITREQLDMALDHQRKHGGLFGDVLIDLNIISAQALSDFVLSDRFSRLGEVLIETGLLTPDQLREVTLQQHYEGGRLGDICVRSGYFTQLQLDRAIQLWHKKRFRLGDTLLAKGYVTQAQLDEALAMQARSGGKLGETLVFMGILDENTLYDVLASQLELGRTGVDFNLTNVNMLPLSVAQRYNAVVYAETADHVQLAVRDRLNADAAADIQRYLDKPIEQVLVTLRENEKIWESTYRDEQKHISVFGLFDEQAENSAVTPFTNIQLIVLLCIGMVLACALVIDWSFTLIALNIVVQIIYFLMTALKFGIVFRGLNHNIQLQFTPEQIAAIDERDLPVYTVLVPVFREKEVVQKLMENISVLDYPQTKLDVRILLEEEDTETLDVLAGMNLPPNFTPVIVPKAKPQTKPKACNYGLLHARGDYVVIYDAEDRPEKDQLKKAYLAFQQLPEEYVCIQAKLNYYNSGHNFLTRLFTQEYSMWFELLLVGIMQMEAPIPLGGTSNHFKMSFLKRVGGWDPFNVTEDADLGVRLYKFNYKTAVLDSRTWEEANSKVNNWIRQRSRWIKGYMLTWLVHMRHPVTFYKTVGFKGFINFQAMILGTPVLPLINPIFWALMILWYATHAHWIASLFPGALYYIATIQFVFGNFAFTYMNVIGMYHVTRECSQRGNQPFSYGIIKYALLTPLYWVLMSFAAYKALGQLIVKPSYWEKTNHGLTSNATETSAKTSDT